MRVELFPGLSNVIRFPLELHARPSLELMRELAPDVREIMAIAEAFGIETPAHDLRARVDEETAAHIAAHLVPSDPPWVRVSFLNQLLDSVVAGTIAACREAQTVWAEVTQVRDALQGAYETGVNRPGPEREQADALIERAATLLIEAHGRVEEAEGVARAVDFARRGEPWVPRDHEAETDALLAYRRPA